MTYERLLCEASEALRVAANDLRLLKRHLPNPVARGARKAARRIDQTRAELVEGVRVMPPTVPLEIAEEMAEGLRALPPLLMNAKRQRALARFEEVTVGARPDHADSTADKPCPEGR